jgi:molecular chaperone DnaK
MGGVMTKMIAKNTTIPTKFSQVFSTADDNQAAVTIKIFQGEREIAAGNKALGEFNLEGIAPAARGTPQIDVTFDIDANGILHVGARDKATGKENKITIKANSGLTEQEIRNMVLDAEQNAEADHAIRLLAEARNKSEAAIHTVRKTIATLGAGADQEAVRKVELLIIEVEAALDAANLTLVESRTEALQEAAALLQKPAASAAPQPEAAHAEEAVDADFKDVSQ